MAYRSHPQYRSWNALALGIKTEETVENPDKVDDSWSKDSWRKPRRESWSQPTQRGGRGTRGRGVWFIDNRPQTIRRRNTMPNSSLYFQNQDQNYNYRTNDRSDDYNQHEVNPIWEESSRNLSTSPNEFMAKEDDSGKYDDQNFQDETSSWNRDSSFADNAYRSPKSRSTSYLKEHWKTNSNNDDGIQSQSRGYLNGYPKESKGYEPDDWERESTNNKPDQAWVHDKYEGSIGSDSDSRDRKDASTQVTQLDINNQFPEKINTGESTKRVNKSDSPKVQNKSERQIIINSELPKEITIKFSDLTLKDSNKSINKSDNEWSESMVSQTPIQEELPSMSPEVTSEVISEMTSEVISEVTSEVTSEVVTPKEEVLPILINLEEVDNSSLKEKKEPKISQDILSLDWFSYQKALIEEELKLTMERQAIQTSRPYKLDTGLKDFDTLI